MLRHFCFGLFFIAATFSTNVAHAQSVINFSDGVFTTLTNSGINDAPVDFTETVDGVTFTLESTLNLVGTERFLNLTSPSNGLQVGGGGGSTIEFTFQSDQDVTLSSYSTDITPLLFLGDPTFDVTGAGVSSVGNSLARGNPANLFSDGPLVLDADELYTFEIQNGGAAAQAFISSITFTTTAVPEPSGIALLGGIGLAILSRRRRNPIGK